MDHNNFHSSSESRRVYYYYYYYYYYHYCSPLKAAFTPEGMKGLSKGTLYHSIYQSLSFGG
jgi:hypothetical protein